MTKTDFKSTTSLVRKTTLANVDAGLIFVLNEESEDSYKDVCRVNGWRFGRFNGVALFNHQKDFIVGHWQQPYVEGKKLKAKLILAPAGSSPRIDEIRALVSCGALRACSVGFSPIRSRPRDGGGVEYLEQDLLECSLVAIGAHPSALLEAKALGVSTAMIKMIFKEQTKAARRVDKHYTAQEKAEVMRRAEKLLGKKITQNQKLPPLLSPAQKLRIEQDKYNREVMRRTLAQVAKIRAEKAAARRRDILARQNPKPYESDDFITWRGQKIPVPSWRGKKQW